MYQYSIEFWQGINCHAIEEAIRQCGRPFYGDGYATATGESGVTVKLDLSIV